MSLKIWINGSLRNKEDATVSVYDHGLLYGDGVFEGLRSYSGKVFQLAEHIERLWDSAEAIHLKIPLSKQAMCDAIRVSLEANQIEDGYVRLLITRGAGTLGLNPHHTSDPQVIIIADSIELYPEEFYEKGLEIITSSVIRNHPAALHPRIKSLNYLNNILAKIEGLRAGCEETLMLNHRGEVAECTGDNIFIVDGGVISTPPIDAGILVGITRNAVIELARQDGIEVREVPLKTDNIHAANECFLTGTAAEVIPVVRFDGRSIGNGKPGPVTRSLRESFFKLARA